MAQVINTNIASMNAQRNLESSGSTLQTSLQRLSSGLRINSAKDDSAGLSISERMGAQIRGLNQAARNANDGISLAQTAEGAISSMADNLQRLRELAVQAANATNSATDRASIQSEVAQLVLEIDRVSTVTEFNSMKLLDGSFRGQSFQVGANAGQTIEMNISSARSSSLGSSDSAAVSTTGKGAALASGDLLLNGISVNTSLASSDTASSTNAAYSGIAKAAAINAVSSQTGVTATVDATVAVAGTAMSAVNLSQGTITINSIAIAVTTGATTTATRAAVMAAVNLVSDRTGVAATDTGSDSTGIKLTAADGRNITVSMDVLSTNVGIAITTTYAGVTMTSSKDIAISTIGTIANAGLITGTYKTQVATATSIASASTTALAGGDVKINGTIVGSSSVLSYDTASTASGTASAKAKAAAINAISSQTGVIASSRTDVASVAMTAAVSTGTITINGVTSSDLSLVANADTNRAAIVTAINAMSQRTGVVAVDLGGTAAGKSISLTAVDGRNIVVLNNTVSSLSTGLADATTYGTVSLASNKAFTIEQGTSATANAVYTNLGINTGTYGSGRTGQSLSSIDVSTTSGANTAVIAIDNAINSLNSSRASLGSILNRFSSTVSNLGIATENMSAAQSRIRDTDFAKETAKLSRGQILQQAGVAMLAQANSLPNTILALLK
jgi:flagellin